MTASQSNAFSRSVLAADPNCLAVARARTRSRSITAASVARGDSMTARAWLPPMLPAPTTATLMDSEHHARARPMERAPPVVHIRFTA